MTDVLQTVANTPGDLNAAIQSIPNHQLRQAMNSMYQRASADITQFETELANWFDSAMQRVAALSPMNWALDGLVGGESLVFNGASGVFAGSGLLLVTAMVIVLMGVRVKAE